MYYGAVDRDTNQPHGFGMRISSQNGLYEGMWEQGKCQGEGRVINYDLSVFQGNFNNDTPDLDLGKQTSRHESLELLCQNEHLFGYDKHSYSELPTWEMAERSNITTERYQKVQDLRNDIGPYPKRPSYVTQSKERHIKSHDGATKLYIYRGNWNKIHDSPDGYGVYIFDDNSYFEGQIANGRTYGSCRIIQKDGTRYEGDVLDNLRDGH